MSDNNEKPNVNDVFFASDDHATVNAMANAELAETEEERKQYIKEANEAAEAAQREHDRQKGTLHTLSEEERTNPNDPFYAPDEFNPSVKDEEEDDDSIYSSYVKPIAVKKSVGEFKNREVAEAPKEAEPVREEKAEKKEVRVYSENEKELMQIYDKGQEYHELFKNPGQKSNRLMSVAAVKMEKIEQPEDSEARKKLIEEKVKEASEKALGDNPAEKYEGDEIAALQAYLSDVLIGDNAELVSIGVTKTISNSQGSIGENSKTYKDLVVVRWIRDGINHVIAFSPKKDAAIYALVDDSMGNGWKDTFFRAGAVNGEERNDVIIQRHEKEDETYQHELTVEYLICEMMDKEKEILEQDETIDPVERARIQSKVLSKAEKLAIIRNYNKKSETTEGTNE